MSTITSLSDARALLERAIASSSSPALDESDVDLLLRLAESQDELGEVVYPVDKLNARAATGWAWKAGLTAESYDMGGGAGVTLSESQWHKHCRDMAQAYRDGTYSVTGGSVVDSGAGSGATSVRLISPVRRRYDELIGG